MIFVTIGTHDQSFVRLLKRIDEIAPKIKEKIIVQKGYTEYNFNSKNIESFNWADSLKDYYNEARIVISHGGSSTWEFLYNNKKPLIIVPRQEKFKEHFNDHQVEFCEWFEKKTGIKTIYDMKSLDENLLLKYKNIIEIDKKNLKKLQLFLKKIIENLKR